MSFIADTAITRAVVNPALLMIPAVILAFAFAILHFMMPIYSGIFGYDYDPAYQYLMNGVGLMHRYSPNHIDHPGTPVQTLVGIMTFIAWTLRFITRATSLSYALDVVAAPETYLSVAAHLFLVMNCAAIFYLGLHRHCGAGRLPALGPSVSAHRLCVA